MGWLDLPAIKWAASLNGITHVAITLLDVLSAVDEINICVGYEIDGERVDGYPMNQTDLHHARPVYKSLPGWGEDITWCRMRGTPEGGAGLRRLCGGRSRGSCVHDQRRTGAGSGDRGEDRDLGS